MRTIDGIGNWVLILMAGASLVSMIAAFQLDLIVNVDLYSYGLQFSDAWAYPYWTAIRLIFAMSWLSLIATIVFQVYKTRVIRSLEAESQEEEIEIHPTEICELMRSSIDSVKKAYIDKNINITINCAYDLLTVNGNKHLQEVFENTLINGIRYNENKNIEIEVNVSKSLIDEKDFIKMEFVDNGIGVSDERKQIIFKQGNRELKGSKGMGLGLSLVKKILKVFHGKIWVEDKVKGDYTKGSNFVILIPEFNKKE